MNPTDREYRRCLRALVWQVEETLRALDAEMKTPSDVDRGRRISAICNALEMGKDTAKRYGLRLMSSKPITRPAP